MPNFEKVGADVWVQPIEDGYKMMCCDCRLVHEMDFRVVDGRAQFRSRRNNRSTANARRALPAALWRMLRR